MQFYKLKPFFEFENIHDLHDRKHMIQTIYSELSANPYAIDLLTANQDKIDWSILSGNPNAIELLARNTDKINWHILSSNPNAIKILTNHPDKINWIELARNTGARSLLTKEVIENYKDNVYFRNGFLANPSMANEILRLFYKSFHGDGSYRKRDWWAMSANPNPLLINHIYQLHNVINWDLLSANPCAIKYISYAISDMKSGRNQYRSMIFDEDDDPDPQEIDWFELSSNPNAMEFIISNPNEIAWHSLTRNPSAIDFLRQNLDCIDWDYNNLHKNPNAADLLIEHPDIFNSCDYPIVPTTKAVHILDKSYNRSVTTDLFIGSSDNFERTREIWRMPSIFELDYKALTRCKYYDTGLFEELYKNLLHPDNIPKFAGWGFEDFELYSEFSHMMN